MLFDISGEFWASESSQHIVVPSENNRVVVDAVNWVGVAKRLVPRVGVGSKFWVERVPDGGGASVVIVLLRQGGDEGRIWFHVLFVFISSPNHPLGAIRALFDRSHHRLCNTFCREKFDAECLQIDLCVLGQDRGVGKPGADRADMDIERFSMLIERSLEIERTLRQHAW